MTAALITEQIVDPGKNMMEFIVDASSIGLKPGEWPDTLATNMGNTLPFAKISADAEGTHVYRQIAGGITLTVLND
jgi:hypothetical protein